MRGIGDYGKAGAGEVCSVHSYNVVLFRVSLIPVLPDLSVVGSDVPGSRLR